MSSADFITAYTTPPDESGVGEAAETPIVGAEASPAGGAGEAGGLPEPKASATIVMGEYVIEFADGELTTRQQVVRIDNIGVQPHFIGWFQVPDGTTTDDIQTVLDEEQQGMMTGTPPAYFGLNPNTDLMPVTFTATQPTDTSIRVAIDVHRAPTP